MKLSVISFQNPSKGKHPRFSDIYEQAFSNESNEKFRQVVQAMLALLRHLENEVDAPEHWVCFSHGDLMFYSKDIENFNRDFNDARRLQVGMAEEEPGVYQVGNRTTNDVRIAGEWIRQILQSPENV